MSIRVILFGQIADITGSSSIVLENVADMNELKRQMHTRYPALATMKYTVAVDKKVVTENVALSNNNTIALLPPFSGG